MLLGYRQRGDADLFAELVRRYERELYSYLRRYLGDAEMAGLPAEYRHEPAAGLNSGSDGLDVVRRILSGAALAAVISVAMWNILLSVLAYRRLGLQATALGPL